MVQFSTLWDLSIFYSNNRDVLYLTTDPPAELFEFSRNMGRATARCFFLCCAMIVVRWCRYSLSKFSNCLYSFWACLSATLEIFHILRVRARKARISDSTINLWTGALLNFLVGDSDWRILLGRDVFYWFWTKFCDLYAVVTDRIIYLLQKLK